MIMWGSILLIPKLKKHGFVCFVVELLFSQGRNRHGPLLPGQSVVPSKASVEFISPYDGIEGLT